MPEKDTLAKWLYNRFSTLDMFPHTWERMSQDDKDYWEHEANAVRRAVARGGFKEPK